MIRQICMIFKQLLSYQQEQQFQYTITATRSLNVRLPQLSMKNLEKSRDKSNKPTIRSINNIYDYSNSPPKTRTDNISRGSLSTPLQYCRYSCYNICRVDSSFNDQEIFSAQQKSVQRNENSKNTNSDQIEKLSQRIKNLSKTKQKMQESISTKQYKKTEPYIQKQFDKYQPKSPKLILKTEEKNEEVNIEQKKLIQEKMQEIYAQVQSILKSHKGYVRQVEKKNVYIQLVQLKKEFKLVNQDYNEFYVNQTNEQFKLNFELVDRIEQLKKLFENKKPTKRNCGSLFDVNTIYNLTLIQTEADEKPNNIEFNEISEKDFEQSQDLIGQFADQMTDCSPANSTTRRRTTNQSKRATKQYSIQPIQIQQETTQQTQISKRKSSAQSINTPLTPKTPDSPSSMTSRNNKFAAQQIIQQKLKLPATPPRRQDSQQFQEDQTNVLKKEIQKRQSKLISRKATLEMSHQQKQKSRLNSRNSLVEVTEHSENEQKVIPNKNATNQSQSNINIENNPEINYNFLDQLENHKEQITIEISTQKQPQNQIVSKKEQQNTKKQEIKESKIIQDLYQSTFIYDHDILNKHRKNKHKNEWSQDIQSVMSNYYQFF